MLKLRNLWHGMLVALVLGGAAAAQTSSGNDLSLGESVDAGPRVGQAYVLETNGDWTVRCVKAAEGRDPCNMFQILNDQNDNPVSEIAIFPLPTGQQAVAGGNIITPLETLLTQQLTLVVDSGEAKRYPFTFCSERGCVARIGLTAADVRALETGNTARVVIVPAQAPDQVVELTVSLTGFTASYDALLSNMP